MQFPPPTDIPVRQPTRFRQPTDTRMAFSQIIRNRYSGPNSASQYSSQGRGFTWQQPSTPPVAFTSPNPRHQSKSASEMQRSQNTSYFSQNKGQGDTGSMFLPDYLKKP